MPERQALWRQVAWRLGGTWRIETGVTQSRYELRAEIQGIAVRIDATSTPYSNQRSRTEIRAVADAPLGVRLHLSRNYGPVPLHRRFLMRDVLIGAPIFDESWIINSRREAHAQAFLDPRVCALINAVPVNVEGASYLGKMDPRFYAFSLRGRIVTAECKSFEANADRLEAAVTAAVALAKQPQALLEGWQALATELDAKLEYNERFRMDGSTRIRFPLHGRRIVVAPRMVRLGLRRDRLRTRIRCDGAGGKDFEALHWDQGDSMDQFGANAELAGEALRDAKAIALRGNSKLVEIDLDGNVVEAARVIAAGSLVALLSRGKDANVGPYR